MNADQAAEHSAVAGTARGYQWHQRNDIPACPECKEGHRLRVQRYRDNAAPEKAIATIPLLRLIELVDLVPDNRRDEVEALLGEELAEQVHTVRTVHKRPVRARA